MSIQQNVPMDQDPPFIEPTKTVPELPEDQWISRRELYIVLGLFVLIAAMPMNTIYLRRPPVAILSSSVIFRDDLANSSELPQLST